MPSPNQGTGSSLYGVAAISAGDVWAVGTYYDGSRTQTLIEHWDGSVWSIIPSPNVGPNSNYLNGIAAVAANDVWAVGGYDENSILDRTLIQHWDGTAWSVASSPSPGTSHNILYSVAATSPNDVWAVGFYANSPIVNQTLIEHWDGTAWSVVPSPNVGSSDNSLRGVVAVSPNDAWAVGGYRNATGGSQTLVEHWNGATWSVVPTQNQVSGINDLYAVTAVSDRDVWGVGLYVDNSNGLNRTLIERYNPCSGTPTVSPSPTPSLTATAPTATLAPPSSTPTATSTPICGPDWVVVSSPNVGTGDNYLYGLATVSSSDVWAVGIYLSSGTGAYQTLVEHWDGSAWSVVPSPNVGDYSNHLFGVDTISASDIWAVGTYHIGTATRTLVEHWDGSAWSVVPAQMWVRYTILFTQWPRYRQMMCGPLGITSMAA